MSTHSHDPHAPVQEPEGTDEFEILELAVRELAIEKGIFSAEDHRRFSEWAESRTPMYGSKLVAKAWLDPAFKERLLADGTEASKEVGVNWLDPTGTGTPSDYTYFYVLENTPQVHNVIVCTLCSCYPRPVLGMSPDWYRTPNYRRRLVRQPRQVLAEFGLFLPADVEIRVHDSNQKSRFMVMPMRPAGTEGWTEEQLAAIVTRDTMIGVALPQPGWTAAEAPSRSGVAHQSAEITGGGK
ncbi:thiocyanate hydrolase subunit gamma [Microbispora bryophytorum]|uniref:thiocyanate hydrolase subunit gamma n=1 Tax=Microbispora bryophytorum TaxID=1460882 RepID=UPI0033DE5533